MKLTRLALQIAASVLMLAAAVCAIAAYWDKLTDLFYTICDKLEERKANRAADLAEFDDYDDALLEE